MTEKVYEEAPFEVLREWRRLIGSDVAVMIRAKVVGVGAKAVRFEVPDITGGADEFSLPFGEIEEWKVV